MASMRDIFLDRLFDYAKKDRNIVVLSADFSAPATDRWRLELPNQYIFTGISEQNTILTAVGMALEGKKVFCYAIAPFLSMRCFEQIRLYLGGMGLPITLVGVGAGVSYEDAGYTHHALEDVTIIRSLPNIKIFQPCDNKTVENMVDKAIDADYPIYVRLDRFGLDNINIENGYKGGLRQLDSQGDISIVASGNMVEVALRVSEKLKNENIRIGVVDVCEIPFDSNIFKGLIKDCKRIITIEEHTLRGGFGSYILEEVADLNIDVRVKRLGLNNRDGYCHEYGGRELIHSQYGLDVDSVVDVIKTFV